MKKRYKIVKRTYDNTSFYSYNKPYQSHQYYIKYQLKVLFFFFPVWFVVKHKPHPKRKKEIQFFYEEIDAKRKAESIFNPIIVPDSFSEEVVYHSE